jgi:hypothetical protein
MSHRGNLVIADKKGYQVYKCHCALVMPQLMFWGSEFAIDFIEEHTSSQNWYDVVDDEGSILIDTSQKIVFLYGGEFISVDIPRRRLFLELMNIVWVGWDIQWAKSGLFDIVDHINYPREKVDYIFDASLNDNYLEVLEDTELPEPWHDSVASIKFSDDDIRIQYASDTFELLQFGKKLIEKMWNFTSLTELNWENDDVRFPIEGIHIDKPSTHIYFWSARSLEHSEQVQKYWKHWDVSWLKDDFETHIRLTNNHLNLNIPSNEVLLAELQAVLLVDPAEFTEAHKNDYVTSLISHGVQIPQYMSHYIKWLPPIEIREKIFNRSVELWQASHLQ